MKKIAVAATVCCNRFSYIFSFQGVQAAILNNSFFLRVTGVFSTESPSAEPLTSVADGPEGSSSTDPERPTLPRSTSERLLAANREFVAQEKELREKYHEIIYGIAEKVMRTSQANQFKSLKVIIQFSTFHLPTEEFLIKIISSFRLLF